MQYFGGVCKFQVGTSLPFAPNSLKVKTEPGASIHKVMFIHSVLNHLHSHRDRLYIQAYLHSGLLVSGLAKSGLTALKILHILHKGRVQSGYKKTEDIYPKWESAFRLCILHLHLYCSPPWNLKTGQSETPSTSSLSTGCPL
jgi:hypothetical protein